MTPLWDFDTLQNILHLDRFAKMRKLQIVVDYQNKWQEKATMNYSIIFVLSPLPFLQMLMITRVELSGFCYSWVRYLKMD
jgi:hypothetical protein